MIGLGGLGKQREEGGVELILVFDVGHEGGGEGACLGFVALSIDEALHFEGADGGGFLVDLFKRLTPLGVFVLKGVVAALVDLD